MTSYDDYDYDYDYDSKKLDHLFGYKKVKTKIELAFLMNVTRSKLKSQNHVRTNFVHGQRWSYNNNNDINNKNNVIRKQ
jgi:hypothetical protein